MEVKKTLWIQSVLSFGLFSAFHLAFAQAEYPQEWPSMVANSGQHCYQLDGVYHYVGEKAGYAKDGPKKPLLDATIFGHIPIRGNPVAVKIIHRVEDGSLAVTVIGENLSPPERVSFSIKVACIGGWTVFEEDVSGYADGTQTAFKSISKFAKGNDGSLVIYATYEVDSRELFIISRRRRGEDWYRFQTTTE